MYTKLQYAYDVWTHVIQSIIKLHAVMSRIKKIQS